MGLKIIKKKKKKTEGHKAVTSQKTTGGQKGTEEERRTREVERGQNIKEHNMNRQLKTVKRTEGRGQNQNREETTRQGKEQMTRRELDRRRRTFFKVKESNRTDQKAGGGRGKR